MKISSLLLALLLTLTLAAQTYKAGTPVEIKWSNSWYKGTILEVKGTQYKITYTGYSSSWDEWVGADRLRLPATSTASASTPSAAKASTTTTSVNPAQAAQYAKTSGGRLYLKTYFYTTMYGSSLDVSWIFLGSDGTVVRNPKNGVNPINYKAELTGNENNVGKYKISGNTIMVTWANGSTSKWNTTAKNGEYETIDGGIVSRQTGMPANYRLSGTFTASAFLSGLSSVHKLTFNKDGSFVLNKSGAVATSNVAALSQGQSGGTYNITGNTLTLNFADGQKQVSVICIWDNGSKKNLVINSSYFPQDK